VYLLFQNFPRDNNALFLIDGKMCASLTASERYGASNSTVYDAYNVVSSGCLT